MRNAGLIRLSPLHARKHPHARAAKKAGGVIIPLRRLAGAPATSAVPGLEPEDDTPRLSSRARVLATAAITLCVALYGFVIYMTATPVDWQRQIGPLMPGWPWW